MTLLRVLRPQLPLSVFFPGRRNRCKRFKLVWAPCTKKKKVCAFLEKYHMYEKWSYTHNLSKFLFQAQTFLLSRFKNRWQQIMLWVIHKPWGLPVVRKSIFLPCVNYRFMLYGDEKNMKNCDLSKRSSSTLKLDADLHISSTKKKLLLQIYIFKFWKWSRTSI